MKVRLPGYNLYNKYERKVGEAGTPWYNKLLPKTINIHLITYTLILIYHMQCYPHTFKSVPPTT
jgi:hypothetical protein